MAFDINKVQKYFQEIGKKEIEKYNKICPDNKNTKSLEEQAAEDIKNMPQKNFNIRSIFSLFDKNHDSKITRNEFEQVSEADYNSFVNGLKEYNIQNNRASENNSIWNYAKMQSYLNDHISPDEISEDEVLLDDVDAFYMDKKSSETGIKEDGENIDYSGTFGFKETFNLKDLSQMTNEEMIAELESYGIKPKSKSTQSLILALTDARRERAKNDIGSNSVDGHIGTFVQNKTGVCTVLAQIGAMSDEEIRQLYVFDDGHSFDNPMIDENGKKYWKIKFPIDKDDSKIVQITEDELKSGEIKVKEFGETKTIRKFPEGDDDVTALSMAFVKRFGSEIVQYGEWSYITKNRFTKPEDIKYKDNQHLEMISDYKSLEGSVINGLSLDELKRKGFDAKQLKDEDLSWIPNKLYRSIAQLSEGIVYTLANGQNACISRHGVFLEDGTKFEQQHAMEIRRYDEQTNELIISGSEFSNISEVRIPVELLQFFETASLPGTPGVDQTPDPGLIDHKI